jgi:hypothetical protein
MSAKRKKKRGRNPSYSKNTKAQKQQNFAKKHHQIFPEHSIILINQQPIFFLSQLKNQRQHKNNFLLI